MMGSIVALVGSCGGDDAAIAAASLTPRLDTYIM
mgnify:CR=1 FL=1